MELTHTSPAKIEKIEVHGLFDSFLFFSSKEYSMSNGAYLVYKLEIDEDSIVDASQLYYHDDAAKLDSITSKFAMRFDLSIDDAEEIISERAQLSDFREFDGEESHYCQLVTARAAAVLGYRGVKVRDEQGSAYMIEMLGKESELQCK